jgi:peptidoglycan hydrolase-like protein with peptidoglycan-binding domain
VNHRFRSKAGSISVNVQWLLNAWLRRCGAALLTVDGIAGLLTEAAIRTFQQEARGAADGRVDPGGPTIRALLTGYFGAIRAAMPLYLPSAALRIVVPPLQPDALDGDLTALFEATARYRARRPARPPSPPQPQPQPPNLA